MGLRRPAKGLKFFVFPLLEWSVMLGGQVSTGLVGNKNKSDL